MTTPETASPDRTEDRPLRIALRATASALKAAGVPFALAGGYALWVHGAPEPSHDVDLVVAEEDVEVAVRVLAAAGLRVERPPEDWLFKVYVGPALVDVLHRVSGRQVDAAEVAAAPEQEVLGLRLPVLPPTRVVAAKLAALAEHSCDLEPLLAVVRAVREQLDWTELTPVATSNPYAEAFLVLARRLELTDGV